MEKEGMSERSTRRRVPLVLVCGLLSGCGAGVAAVVASSGSSSGGTTPSLNGFTVDQPKISPASLVLDARQAVRVALTFDAGGGEHPMKLLGGPVGNEVSLSAGVNPPIQWDFESDLGDTRFKPSVHLIARRPGGEVLGGGEIALGMGNDAPVIEVEDPLPEVDGVVPIQLRISDSSGDALSIRVEFDVQGDALGFLPARPGGLDAKDPTPRPAMSGIVAPAGGTELVFFWDTDSDLAELERDVHLRFTPIDPVVEGTPQETAAFRVDNNATPIVQLQNDLVVTNPDERRGIPIPFRVIDEEGDRVEVVLQWRAEGHTFPSLDLDGDGELENADIDAILADPVLREERQVCTPYPHFARGDVVPVDADTVRLPELAGEESWLVASGLEGRTLELLRPPSILVPITPTWQANPLDRPVSALSLGDGSTALVLDAPGAVRLRVIELATGAVAREVATIGAGLPSAMCFEHGGAEAVLVAIDDAVGWRIERVELEDGAVTELLVSDGSEPGPVRGIASLGTKAAVFTAGSSLFRLDYGDPLMPRFARLASGLATPAGVVVDSLAPDRIYVSERDANRILAVELDSRQRLPVVVRTADLQIGRLDAPTALALERDGSRLLIVTSAPDGQQLVGLDLGATGGNVSFPIGTPSTAELASVSTGPDELRLLCQPLSNELLVAGGLEQRRAIAAHATSTEDVMVEAPFDPVPRPNQPWRIPAEPRIRASAEGVPVVFVWDSADAHDTSAFVRAIARDDEVGLASEGAAAKSLRSPFDVEPFTLGGLATTPLPTFVGAGDLDADGDQDIVSANYDGDDLTIFYQVSPGSYQALPLVLGGPGTTDGPAWVAAADLDGDGDQDIGSANYDSNDLTVFFQVSTGSYQAPPLVLGGGATTSAPRSVAVADLDADGDQDIVSANSGSATLTVFFQVSPGSFGSSPLVLGGFPTTNFLVSVVAADLDGDGDQDLATAGGGGLTVFFQISPGGFQDPPVSGFPGNGANSVAAADIDGDGDQDLVTTNEFCSDICRQSLMVFFQSSPGVFAIEPMILGGEGMTDGSSMVATADLDGDGDQDLVSANAQGNDLAVFYQTKPGRFEEKPEALGSQASTPAPLAVAAADLDGDGKIDLVSANSLGDDLTIFFQSRPGVFAGEPDVLGGPNTMDRPVELAAGDLDGDGVLDLVSANFFDNSTIFSQLGPGTFEETPLTLIARLSENSLSSVAVAEMDGDGAQDVVTASFANELRVFFQRGPGFFPSLRIDVTSSPSDVKAADLDGDGDQDLVAASAGGFSGDDNLTVFFQSLPGSFEGPLVLDDGEITSGTHSSAAADLDGDGDLDLVSASSGSGSRNLTLFFQVSPGTFAPLGGLVAPNSPSSVAATDLDGDGDLDLVSANQGFESSNLTVFFQVSPGNFQASPLVLGGHGSTNFPASVAAADLDGDGDQDLASANSNGDNLTVFFQSSPGRFRVPLLVLGGPTTTSGPGAVVAAGLDGDGDHDLASANQRGSNLAVFWGGR
jgi:hypothetical protein